MNLAKNPFINAALASAYIWLVVSVISYFEHATPEGGGEFFVVPVAFLSLFVLSAATMGFLFLYEPLTLWFDGKRAEAVNFFLTMVATFGFITFALLAVVFYLMT